MLLSRVGYTEAETKDGFSDPQSVLDVLNTTAVGKWKIRVHKAEIFTLLM